MIKNSTIAFSVLLTLFLLFSYLEGAGSISEAFYYGYTISAVLNFINFVVALGIFSYAASREMKKFVNLIMISVLGRMFFLALSVIIVIKVLEVNKTAFILNFFIIYFIFLFSEIVYYKHRLIKKN